MSISRGSILHSLASASLAAVVVLAGGTIRASAQAQEPASAQDEPTEEPSSHGAPTVPTNAPTPGAVAREPVAKAEDVAFDAEEESSQAALRFNEPTFNTETTRKRVPNVPLLATGTLVLVSSYIPAVVGGALSDRAGDNKLTIPVAGPFLAMNHGAADKAGYKTLFVADGVAQGLGGLGMLLSFVIPEKITERWYLIGQRVRMSPARIAGGYGLSAAGRF